MAMEKRGVISEEDTPQYREREGKGEPTTKEAADRMESHPVNDMIDAVAERTKQNKR